MSRRNDGAAEALAGARGAGTTGQHKSAQFKRTGADTQRYKAALPAHLARGTRPAHLHRRRGRR